MIKVGLNIGNSKISCAVLEAKENQDFKLLSCESYASKILKKNLITNFDELLNEIKSLIKESEKKSQTKINSINLNIPWSDLGSWKEICKVYGKLKAEYQKKKNIFYRPWGRYTNLYYGKNFLIKELYVKPKGV